MVPRGKGGKAQGRKGICWSKKCIIRVKWEEYV